MQMLVIQCAYIGLLAFALVSDIRNFKIPNVIPTALLAFFLFYAFMYLTPAELGRHLMIGGIALLAGVALFVFRILGGGDIKLMVAILVWAGPRHGMSFVMLTAVVGGVLAIMLLGLRKSVAGEPFSKEYSISSQVDVWMRRGVYPYGVAICGSGLVLMPSFFTH